MNPRSKKSEPTKYGSSKTVPGQALKPSDLLKRHLAGTLPPIDLSKRYEFHYNEKGEQVSEPLPLELHEVHKLSVAIRQKQWEQSLEKRKKQAEKHAEEIIAEYLKKNPQATQAPVPKPGEGAPSTGSPL